LNNTHQRLLTTAVVDGRPIDGRLDKNDGETLLFRNGEVVRKETQFAFSMFTSKIIE
jgi:hypothetical protein